jgi:aspartyl-tRNA(Asn)/glutamyl-tRNA(Gln) amidotransferase subunit C
MSITRDEVRRIAELARLEISDSRIDRMAAELSAVLEFAEALKRLDLSGCEPTAFAPAEAPLREDALDGRRLSTDTALAAAPEGEHGFFLVPPVVENLNP